MMYRLSQLTEIRHSLSRARALAEEQHLIHLANTLTHSIGVLNNEIHDLEKLREKQAVPPQPKPTRTRKKMEDNPILEGESKC
jgi:hypothetical protein